MPGIHFSPSSEHSAEPKRLRVTTILFRRLLPQGGNCYPGINRLEQELKEAIDQQLPKAA
jgi:hypothetical protein